MRCSFLLVPSNVTERPERIDFYFIPISVTGPTLQLPYALPGAPFLLNYG